MNTVYNVFQIINNEKSLVAVFSNQDAAEQYISESLWKHPDMNLISECWKIHDKVVLEWD